MKDSSGPRKTTSTLPESVRHYLNGLSIAIILAGVGLLALASPTEAQIVYTPVDVTIGENSSYNLDLNNDGVTDFIISTNQSAQRCPGPGGGHYGVYDTVAETPASDNGAEGSPPARLQNEGEIGPSQAFYAGTGTMAWARLLCANLDGGGDNWIDEQSCGFYCASVTGLKGYLGLMFQINGETHYGWALLRVEIQTNDVIVILKGYAYETTPGMPIKAGQTE